MRNGSWTPVFAIAIAADLTTAVLAIAVLKPMRARAGYCSRGRGNLCNVHCNLVAVSSARVVEV